MSESNGNTPNSGTNGQPTGGNGGSLFSYTQQQAGGQRHLRSDARLAAKLISLGVVPEETAAVLLKQGFVLGAQSANQGNVRNYAACMKMLLGAARLEQIERLREDPDLPLGGVNIENAQIIFNVPDNGRGPKRIDEDDDSDLE